MIPLSVLTTSSDTQKLQVVMKQPDCTPEEIEAVNNGEKLGCCVDPEGECYGMHDVGSYLDCRGFDDCKVQWIERRIVTAKLPGLDLTGYPYDEHHVQLNAYVANPYVSMDVEWWKAWQPPPVQVIFR